MKYPNKIKTFAQWTDWNRKGAKGHYGGIGWYRIVNGLGKIQNVTVVGEKEIGGKDRAEIAKKIGENKVMYIKYIDSINPIMHLLAIRDSQDMKLIVDIDDNVFKVHPHNYAYKDISPESEAVQNFAFLFKEADALVCSTEPLAEYMKAYNKNVFVIPNTTDPEIWNVPVKKNRSKKIRIGWVNGPTHEQDAPVLVPVLKELFKKYGDHIEFHHIGWQSPEFDNIKGDQKMVFGTKGFKEYPAFLASLGMDILVAPLIDDEFNRGKSHIKWMEGAMLEIPMVCSDVYPYSKAVTHGKDGFLAKSTSEWIKYLSWLIEDKELRQKIGKEAKVKTLAEHQVKDVLPKYVEVLESVAKPDPEVTVVITRRKGESDKESLGSLQRQTYRNIKFIRLEDRLEEGANVLRNRGWKKAKSPYVLFSDNDLTWNPFAVKKLVKALEDNPDCDYSFGAYLWNWDGKVNVSCDELWSAERLKDWKKGNIVSTMALVRREAFTGFDPEVKRLQDWDAWLTMLEHGKKGVHCGDITFETTIKQGISFENKETSYQDALVKLVAKHNLE